MGVESRSFADPAGACGALRLECRALYPTLVGPQWH